MYTVTNSWKLILLKLLYSKYGKNNHIMVNTNQPLLRFHTLPNFRWNDTSLDYFIPCLFYFFELALKKDYWLAFLVTGELINEQSLVTNLIVV